MFCLTSLPGYPGKKYLVNSRTVEYLLNVRLLRRSYLFPCPLFCHWKINTFAICYISDPQSASVELCPYGITCDHSKSLFLTQKNPNIIIRIARKYTGDTVIKMLQDEFQPGNYLGPECLLQIIKSKNFLSNDTLKAVFSHFKLIVETKQTFKNLIA